VRAQTGCLVGLVSLVCAVENEKRATGWGSETWGMVSLVCLVWLVGRIGFPIRRIRETRETRQARLD